MDGFKKQLNASIQRKLSFSVSLAIVVVALLAGVFSFITAFNEAQDLQDDTLEQVAMLFDRQALAPLAPGSAPDSPDDSRVIVQHLAGGATAANAPLPLPATLPDGLHTLKVNDQTLRVLVKTTARAERIAVAQDTDVRDEIARNSAWHTLLPLLVLVPVLLLVVADLVRKMFRPIAALSAEIDQRAEQALHPVQEVHLPSEVRPFVVAINRLLARVAQSMDTQRRFIADAAHELRSPLTAMSLQAERLADAPMSALASERLATLRRGMVRSQNLLNQLLALAQAQGTSSAAKSPAPASTSIQRVYRSVLEDLMPLAEARHIDIGMEELGDGQDAQDVQVQASAFELTTLVKNLVDNAIRYTPEGGRVDLGFRRAQGRAVLRIQDTGPGIAVAERARVFDAFYRTLGSEQTGSGLGLCIVQAIAQRLGAQVRLTFSDEAAQSGLCVEVFMALAPPPPGDRA
ncbi:two-component system OmpR family sensor kinase [Polaromonas sp. CG_9.5]|uniref:ATP-binding protein n=1 Tax=Polaromonas sp. CG_9.5 TaxID=3071705 RepID=UPI002E0B4FAF|nr:two-component system OmpR family sensor kinase [Polaromonas sp. CG_9.5]